MPGGRPHVLVVNDDVALAEGVRRLLCSEGYEARVVVDGLAAIEALADWPADLVLLDLLMPRMDGLCFLQHRSEDPTLARAPVLVWSVAGPDEFEHARQLGAVECLPRTRTSPDSLLDSVARLVRQVSV